MSRTLLLNLLLSLSCLALLTAGTALAQDEDEQDPAELPEPEADDDDEGEGDDDEGDDEPEATNQVLEEGMDNESIYSAYKAEVLGEDSLEEADAWKAYLDAYPQSLFRLEIEARIDALDEASFDELLEDQGASNLDSGSTTGPGEGRKGDAKSAEMDLREPLLINMNANTRRKAEFGVVWGFQDYFNYELSFEWAFRRQFSAFGAIRHTGKGIGAGLQAGAKYALVKDTRTGILLSGAFSINLGYSAFDQVNFGVEPWLGFGWIASDLIQVQSSVAFSLRIDRLHTAVLWDLMLVITPTEKIGIYIESRQKHSLFKPEGQEVRYLGFHQAGVGVKIRPNEIIELGLGANIPYGWKHWKDYRYVGVHANLCFYFKKPPRN